MLTTNDARLHNVQLITPAPACPPIDAYDLQELAYDLQELEVAVHGRRPRSGVPHDGVALAPHSIHVAAVE
jgi:hypothetical protein